VNDILPWESAPHLPWQHFSSLADQWQALPSFLIGEYMFIAAALLALLHASRRGKANILIWLAAVIAGTANDLIFMALPLVDNFWQAQATLMWTPRLPVYIPCVYICFLYYPTVAARRIGLGPLATAALAGLAGSVFYAPYDIVGAKFLWWNWHDTDLSIAVRLLGAPVSSSLWVITFTSSFCWLVGRALPKDLNTEISGAMFAKGFALVAGLTTVAMMVQITIVQQLDGGTPGYFAFGATIAIYATLIAVKWSAAAPRAVEADTLARNVVFAHFATLVLIMALFTPETHRSEGLHQPPGTCGIEVTDLTGSVRHQYLCATDFDEDYTFACTEPPADGTEWYTICGSAHTNFPLWLAGVTGLSGAGAWLFTMLFAAIGVNEKRRKA
jgi:hypothetical protein